MACDNPQPDTLEFRQSASIETPQTALDGATVPKYVEALPVFSNRRSNGTTTQNIDMVEFQQRILPASIYASLPAPFNAGSFCGDTRSTRAAQLALGDDRDPRHGDVGQLSQPARGNERRPPGAGALPDRRSDASLGRPAPPHAQQPLRQRTAARGPVRAALHRPDPGRHAPARRRGAVAVRRSPRRLVDAALPADRARRSRRRPTTTSTSKRRRSSGFTTTRWASSA